MGGNIGPGKCKLKMKNSRDYYFWLNSRLFASHVASHVLHPIQKIPPAKKVPLIRLASASHFHVSEIRANVLHLDTMVKVT